jgi:hypothetical protein
MEIFIRVDVDRVVNVIGYEKEKLVVVPIVYAGRGNKRQTTERSQWPNTNHKILASRGIEVDEKITPL